MKQIFSVIIIAYYIKESFVDQSYLHITQWHRFPLINNHTKCHLVLNCTQTPSCENSYSVLCIHIMRYLAVGTGLTPICHVFRSRFNTDEL